MKISRALVMLGAAVTFSTWALSASSASINLVNNGTFDTGLSGWTQGGAIGTYWDSPTKTAQVGRPGTPGVSTFSQNLVGITGANIAYSFDFQWQINKPVSNDTFSAVIKYKDTSAVEQTVDLINNSTIQNSATSTFGVWNYIASTAFLAGIDTNALTTIIFTLKETNILPNAGTRIGLDNVSVSNVPLPAAAWLFGSALIGLVAVARRKATA